MSDGEARAAPAIANREGARAAAVPLGWHEIGAALILVIAAAPVRDWVSDQSLLPLMVRAIWWVTYVATAVRLFQLFGAEWLRWLARQEPALCALLVLALASALWSLAPALTLQRAASLLGTTVVSVWMGYVGAPQRIMRVLYWTFTLLIVAGVIVAVAVPPPVVGAFPATWRGIMTNRNSFGAAAALAAAFFLIVTVRRQVHPVWGAALCALSLLALAEARTRTPLIALGVSLLVWIAVAVTALARRSVAALVRVVAIGLVIGAAGLPLLVGWFTDLSPERDPLNGRAGLWAGSVAILRERPWSGYGYAAVWGRGEATLLPHLAVTAKSWAVSAHNSIAHVATELGFPAALIACAFVFTALVDAGRLCERAPSAFSLSALVVMIGIVVMGFAESHLLQIHWMFWMVMVALTVAVRRAVNDETPRTGVEAES